MNCEKWFWTEHFKVEKLQRVALKSRIPQQHVDFCPKKNEQNTNKSLKVKAVASFRCLIRLSARTPSLHFPFYSTHRNTMNALTAPPPATPTQQLPTQTSVGLRHETRARIQREVRSGLIHGVGRRTVPRRCLLKPKTHLAYCTGLSFSSTPP